MPPPISRPLRRDAPRACPPRAVARSWEPWPEGLERSREAHVSTVEAGPQAPARIPRPYGHGRRPEGAGQSARQGPQAPVSLNGDGRGPINNLCVPTVAAPCYGPGDKSLVSVTVLGTGNDPDRLLAEVRAQRGHRAVTKSVADLLQAAGATGRPVNIKKGQWMAASDMRGAVEKVRSAQPDGSGANRHSFAQPVGGGHGAVRPRPVGSHSLRGDAPGSPGVACR